MNHSKDSFDVSPGTSAAIGQLIVRMHSAGLFSSSDVRDILRGALAPTAPVLNAEPSAQPSFIESMYEGYMAAE